MKASVEIPIKIQNKTVGLMRIDEKLFKEVCADEGLEVLKEAGHLLEIALESARLEHELKMLDSMRSDFISNFPHELRVPITVIRESLGMVLDGTLGEINERQKKVLLVAEDSLMRLWRLSEELLELSEIVSAKAPMKRKLLDIVRITAKGIARHRQKAKERGISLDAKLPDKKIRIWADEEKLNRMFDRLIDNAIRYNKANGSVEVSLKVAGNSVRISVSDTGAGIAREDLSRVFDKFYRITMRTRGDGKRWGIGLPLVKEIVQMHLGSVSVESELGRGSVFVVSLPKSLR
jgi:signal transduction histidine kinase